LKRRAALSTAALPEDRRQKECVEDAGACNNADASEASLADDLADARARLSQAQDDMARFQAADRRFNEEMAQLHESLDAIDAQIEPYRAEVYSGSCKLGQPELLLVDNLSREKMRAVELIEQKQSEYLAFLAETNVALLSDLS